MGEGGSNSQSMFKEDAFEEHSLSYSPFTLNQVQTKYFSKRACG